MDEQPPNYHGEFLKSPHHVWLGLVTLGAGFLSASALGLIAGATIYALGWIYMPEMPFFKGWVNRRDEARKRAAALAQVAGFVQKREALLDALRQSGRERYNALAGVCRDIEEASADNPLSSDPNTDPRLRKLDELMWTYLRLLCIEESLERFLETERRDDVPTLVTAAEAEAKNLCAEVDALKAKGGGPAVDSRQRLLESRMERLEVLHKRLQRVQQAHENLDLAVSEQERLDQQIKLIRADAVATRNAESLTARIDATVEHLDQTNKWLTELDEFKDLAGDMPATDVRIGYQTVIPPVIAKPVPNSTIARSRTAQGGR
jgi:hypothetical protein